MGEFRVARGHRDHPDQPIAGRADPARGGGAHAPPARRAGDPVQGAPVRPGQGLGAAPGAGALQPRRAALGPRTGTARGPHPTLEQPTGVPIPPRNNPPGSPSHPGTTHRGRHPTQEQPTRVPIPPWN
ncbi:ATPase, H+ transporting, lysosomal 14kDa, V1 subunit F, partial [Columba livia]